MNAIAPGVYPHMSNEEYQAAPGLRSGMLRDLACMTAKEARHKWDNPEERSDAFNVGEAAHRAILEGDLEFSGFYLLPKGHKGSNKAGMARIDEAKALGKTPLKWEQHQAVKAMAAAILENTLARRMLENIQPEVSLFWIDRETGLLCKARFDGMPRSFRFILDLKTTRRSLSDEDIDREILEYRYDLQGDWYERGARALGMFDNAQFLPLFQQKKPPFDCRAKLIRPSTRAFARVHNDHWKQVYADCLARDEWPGWPEEITEAGAPGWAEKRWEDEDLRLPDWQAPLAQAAE